AGSPLEAHTPRTRARADAHGQSAVDEQLTCLHEVAIIRRQGQVWVPELRHVPEQLAANRVRRNRIVITVPEGGRAPCNPFVFPVQVWLPAEGVDVHPRKLHLRELIDEWPKIRHTPGFTARHKILDRRMCAHPERRL